MAGKIIKKLVRPREFIKDELRAAVNKARTRWDELDEEHRQVVVEAEEALALADEAPRTFDLTRLAKILELILQIIALFA